MLAAVLHELSRPRRPEDGRPADRRSSAVRLTRVRWERCGADSPDHNPATLGLLGARPAPPRRLSDPQQRPLRLMSVPESVPVGSSAVIAPAAGAAVRSIVRDWRLWARARTCAGGGDLAADHVLPAIRVTDSSPDRCWRPADRRRARSWPGRRRRRARHADRSRAAARCASAVELAAGLAQPRLGGTAALTSGSVICTEPDQTSPALPTTGSGHDSRGRGTAKLMLPSCRPHGRRAGFPSAEHAPSVPRAQSGFASHLPRK